MIIVFVSNFLRFILSLVIIGEIVIFSICFVIIVFFLSFLVWVNSIYGCCKFLRIFVCNNFVYIVIKGRVSVMEGSIRCCYVLIFFIGKRLSLIEKKKISM